MIFASAQKIYCVGIKGTGMSSLAQLFVLWGKTVLGSDTGEYFYTEDVLRSCAITWHNTFSRHHISDDIDLLVYSNAWDPHEHEEIGEAKRKNITTLAYHEVLGLLSKDSFFLSIAGVHGKTMTSGLFTVALMALGWSGTSLIGGSLCKPSNTSTWTGGWDFLAAESCEYRRHFHVFSPNIILLSSIEADHLDYFSDYKDIFTAFLDYAKNLPAGGVLVYCCDDPGTHELAHQLMHSRPDIRYVSYGEKSQANYRLHSIKMEKGENHFCINEQKNWLLIYPGRHALLNAVGAYALLSELSHIKGYTLNTMAVKEAFAHFAGLRRRSEVLFNQEGIIIIDDYAHHPTAIRKTLEGYRRFFSPQRIIVDFMPHTYSRTAALKEEFANSFSEADIFFLNDIYASAREKRGNITGEGFAQILSAHHPHSIYQPDFDQVVDTTFDLLREGDLFVSMGAGNNWEISHRLSRRLKERNS